MLCLKLTKPFSIVIVVAVALVAAEGPCDILNATDNPCVAAHSTVRALFANYDGPLYNVTRSSDGRSQSVGLLTKGGFADKPSHDAFCIKLDCVISNVFDQSGNGNHLGQRHKLVNASRHNITVGPHKTPVYGMWFDPGFGYHVDETKNIPKGNDPESIYAVMSGKNYNGGCCFDYGNSETDDKDDGCGTMEAIYFGNAHWHGNTGQGQEGPWAGADLEQGMYYGGGNKTQVNNDSLPLTHDFVSLVLKGREDGFAIKGGDATQGTTTTMYDGPRPDAKIAGTCRKASGAVLALAKCDKEEKGQKWAFLEDGKSISNDEGNCIDIKRFATKKGAQVYAWPCGQDSRHNEDWKMILSSFQKQFTLASLQPNTPFCVGTAGQTSVGASAVLDDCAANTSQFEIAFHSMGGNHSGAIVHKESELCLAAATGSPGSSYQPMRKEGAIILATGGDFSNSAKGNFYEGFMARGYASDETDAKIQENIVAVGYSGFHVPAPSTRRRRLFQQPANERT